MPAIQPQAAPMDANQFQQILNALPQGGRRNVTIFSSGVSTGIAAPQRVQVSGVAVVWSPSLPSTSWQ